VELADPATTHLHTDEHAAYRSIAAEFLGHSAVNHASGEYVRDGVSTNKAESYFSQLKRSIDGTHHHVSKAHLGRYLSEFDFRHSTCKLSDTERMVRVLRQARGRRLTYRPAAS
jgi:hypothetical protein